MCWNGKWWKVRVGKSGGLKRYSYIFEFVLFLDFIFNIIFSTSFSFSYYIFSIISFSTQS